MLSGHFQGRFLAMLSLMIKPECILEIGTYTGYSAICLAEGLREGGILHTIDIDEERDAIVNKYIAKSGLQGKIVTHIGNALQLIPKLDMQFDLVFIDADKQNYCAYYNLVFDKVKKGGYILADNVLWSGKVVDANPDKDTQALLDFNALVNGDTRVENILLPIRDGLMLARKK
jgi:predicted O-methyltransferase YrrM